MTDELFVDPVTWLPGKIIQDVTKDEYTIIISFTDNTTLRIGSYGCCFDNDVWCEEVKSI